MYCTRRSIANPSATWPRGFSLPVPDDLCASLPERRIDSLPLGTGVPLLSAPRHITQWNESSHWCFVPFYLYEYKSSLYFTNTSAIWIVMYCATAAKGGVAAHSGWCARATARRSRLLLLWGGAPLPLRAGDPLARLLHWRRPQHSRLRHCLHLLVCAAAAFHPFQSLWTGQQINYYANKVSGAQRKLKPI